MLISASSQQGFFSTPTNSCRRSRNFGFVRGQACTFSETVFKRVKRLLFGRHTEGKRGNEKIKLSFSSFTQADNLLTAPLWLILCVTHAHRDWYTNVQTQTIIRLSLFSTHFYPEIPVAVVCSIPPFSPVRFIPTWPPPCLLCLHFNFFGCSLLLVLLCNCHAVCHLHKVGGMLSSQKIECKKVCTKSTKWNVDFVLLFPNKVGEKPFRVHKR